jgi:hypothetical protein
MVGIAAAADPGRRLDVALAARPARVQPLEVAAGVKDEIGG